MQDMQQMWMDRYGTSACFHLLSRPMTAAWEAGKPIIMNGGHFSLMGQSFFFIDNTGALAVP